MSLFLVLRRNFLIPSNQVHLDGALRNASCSRLDRVGQVEVSAETGHEIGGGDLLEVCLEVPNDYLEAPADFLFRHSRHCTDFFEGTGNSVFSTGDVEASCRLRLVVFTAQSTAVEHVFEDSRGIVLEKNNF